MKRTQKEEEIFCVAGCRIYEGGERYHHKDCHFYPESLSRMFDDMKTTGCPCVYTDPCHKDCSCVKPHMSFGCRRCCKYGSLEQKKERAVSLALMFDDKKKAVDLLFRLLDTIKTTHLDMNGKHSYALNFNGFKVVTEAKAWLYDYHEKMEQNS